MQPLYNNNFNIITVNTVKYTDASLIKLPLSDVQLAQVENIAVGLQSAQEFPKFPNKWTQKEVFVWADRTRPRSHHSNKALA